MPNEESARLITPPTWAGVLPALIAAIEHGGDEGRDAAISELHIMAKHADRWAAHCRSVKEGKEPQG